MNLTFSYNFHTIQVTMLIFGIQVVFNNTQLGSYHQGRISRLHFLNGRFGGISVSQTHLVLLYSMACSMYIDMEELQNGEVNSQNEVWIKPGKSFAVPVIIGRTDSLFGWEFTSYPKVGKFVCFLNPFPKKP